MEQFEINNTPDTIAAISTPAGVGGIAVIRISGPEAVAIVNSGWKGKDLTSVASHTVHLGKYIATDGNMLDEAVATVFRAPASFTGEDVVEISVHGSRWIQRELISDLIRRGARAAGPGEFTQRAFLNGKLDLAQAEGVADLIASTSKAAHNLALSQTRGNFSRELDNLRDKLIEFASLLELELDFSEEDVEFADRSNLLKLAKVIKEKVDRLAASYSSGAAIKEGVPVVIAGIPNAGKSSLLNLLLNDDKAIVSDIPGTTRDTIEDTIEIDGVLYRFIDTAGLRTTSDMVEGLGIERARDKMRKARIVIWILDPTTPLSFQTEELNIFARENPDVPVILLMNKSDLINDSSFDSILSSSMELGKASRMGNSEIVDGAKLGNASIAQAERIGNSEIKDGTSIGNEEIALAERIGNSEINRAIRIGDEDLFGTPHPESLREAQEKSREAENGKHGDSTCRNSFAENQDSTDLDACTGNRKATCREVYPGNEDSIIKNGCADNHEERIIRFSAKNGEGLDKLRERLKELTIGDINTETELIVTNARHYEALTRGSQSLTRAIDAIKSGISADFIAQDVREALHHLGTITGSVTPDNLLHSIFSHFCIGK